jgi:hypothetical protein
MTFIDYIGTGEIARLCRKAEKDDPKYLLELMQGLSRVSQISGNTVEALQQMCHFLPIYFEEQKYLKYQKVKAALVSKKVWKPEGD